MIVIVIKLLQQLGGCGWELKEICCLNISKNKRENFWHHARQRIDLKKKNLKTYADQNKLYLSLKPQYLSKWIHRRLQADGQRWRHWWLSWIFHLYLLKFEFNYIFTYYVHSLSELMCETRDRQSAGRQQWHSQFQPVCVCWCVCFKLVWLALVLQPK